MTETGEYATEQQPPVSSESAPAAAAIMGAGRNANANPDTAVADSTAATASVDAKDVAHNSNPNSPADSSLNANASYQMDEWRPDTIMDGYQRATVHLGRDGEGDAIATLVRKDPGKLSMRERLLRWRRSVAGKPLAIMYVHGWNDYFYRRHASEYWESLGVAFYAVDLRRYGRSLREGETPGYIEDLHDYAAELNALRDRIVAELGDSVRILGIGHSEGGLIMSLWANRERPHHVRALALNSPWLELQGNTMFRVITTPVLKGFLLAGGKTVLPLNDPGFYGRIIEKSQGGEWEYPSSAQATGGEFLPRAGWMQAIFNGQAEVAAGLDIQVPVLVCTSDKSMLQPNWDESMREADVVLDVTAIRQAALKLGDMVAIARIPGGIHDLTMSKSEARRRYFGIVTSWASVTAWRSIFPSAAVSKALDRL